MQYLVIWHTATHVDYTLYDTETEARDDEHMSSRWCGRMYAIADAVGFTGAEAKALYTHGVEFMAPGWGLTELQADD